MPTRCACTPGTSSGLDIKGHVVKRLWVEHASDIAKEYYASFTLDRPAKLHLGMLSAQGGVEIEEVAQTDPDAIARLHIDPVEGCRRRRPGRGSDRAQLGSRGASTRRRPSWCASTTATSRETATWPRSIRSSSPPRATCTPSTPRSRSTRTPRSATPSGRSTRTTPTSTREKMAKEKGLNYIGLSGHGRHHRQRSRPCHVDARRRHAGRGSRPPTSSTSAAAPTPT